jgi:hypothetical protein
VDFLSHGNRSRVARSVQWPGCGMSNRVAGVGFPTGARDFPILFSLLSVGTLGVWPRRRMHGDVLQSPIRLHGVLLNIAQGQFARTSLLLGLKATYSCLQWAVRYRDILVYVFLGVRQWLTTDCILFPIHLPSVRFRFTEKTYICIKHHIEWPI